MSHCSRKILKALVSMSLSLINSLTALWFSFVPKTWTSWYSILIQFLTCVGVVKYCFLITVTQDSNLLEVTCFDELAKITGECCMLHLSLNPDRCKEELSLSNNFVDFVLTQVGYQCLLHQQMVHEH